MVDTELWLTTLAYAVPVLALVAGIVWVIEHSRKKRVSELRHFAQGLGFRFRSGFDDTLVPPELTAELRQWFLRPRQLNGVRNSMRGTLEGCELLIADYDVGGTNHIKDQTVVGVVLRQTRLPQFCLMPRRFHERLGAALGIREIDFAEDSEFFKRCWLRGENEQAIRACFCPSVRRYFSQHSTLCAVGGDRFLIVFSEYRQVSPAEIRLLIDRAIALAGLLAGGNGTAADKRSRRRGSA